MAYPAQSWSILFAAFLSPLGASVPQGYAITKSTDGLSYVVASTANLATSSSGTIDGIQLNSIANPGDTVQVQRDAKVDKAILPWLGNGGIENAVVDSNGKVWRASQASGVIIGTVDKEGGVSINLAGSGAVAALNLIGDVNGPVTANLVYAISGNAGVVAIKGGTWNIGVGVALSVSQVAPTSDVATNAITWATQPAYSGAVTNKLGGAWIVNLGANTGGVPLGASTAVGMWHLQYSGTDILEMQPTKFFGGSIVGVGLELSPTSSDNSWISIGSTPALSLGIIGVNNGIDAIAARNHANTADLVLIGSDAANEVVIGRTGAAGVNSPSAYISIGPTTPYAASGLLRFANAQTVVVERNAGNTADIVGLAFDANNYMFVGGTAAQSLEPTILFLQASTQIDGVIGASAVSTLNTSGLTLTSLASASASIVTASTAGLLGIVTAVSVANGGTGLTSAGANGNVLTSNGTSWVSQAPSAGVTWANDLAGSTNTSQVVVAMTGSSGIVLVRSTAAIAFNASYATVGLIRMPTTITAIAARNAANTGDLSLVATDASNNAYFGGSSAQANEPSNTYLQAASGVNIVVGATSVVNVTSTFATYSIPINMQTNFIEFNSKPAGIGDISASNGDTIVAFRNFANSADFQALTSGASTDSNDALFVGGSPTQTNEPVDTILQASNYVGVNIGTTKNILQVESTQILIGKPISAPSGTYIQFGGGPAASGVVRASNNTTIEVARNAAGSADINITAIDSLNNAYFGGTSSQTLEPSNTYVQAASGVNCVVGASVVGGYSAGLGWLASGNNFSIGTQTPTWNSATDSMFVTSGTAPTANPVGGGYLFCTTGAGKWRGTSGTITTFGPADPHCQRCDRDFAVEWEHPGRGEHVAVCIPCLLGALQKTGHNLDDFTIHHKLAA